MVEKTHLSLRKRMILTMRFLRLLPLFKNGGQFASVGRDELLLCLGGSH